MDTLSTPAARIRFIAKEFHHSVKGLADALGIQATSLYTYLDTKSGSARSIPGSEMQERFHRIGYSTDWIMFGIGEIKTSENSAVDNSFGKPTVRKISDDSNMERVEVFVPRGMGDIVRKIAHSL